jgi:hypothetical protein
MYVCVIADVSTECVQLKNMSMAQLVNEAARMYVCLLWSSVGS